MMDQTHIGYTYWQQPPENTMPAVRQIEIPEAAGMGVDAEKLSFDVFNRQRRHVDVYNRGRAAFEFSATASAAWIVLSATHGRVEKEQRLWVSVDWTKAPQGSASGTVEINGVTLLVSESNPESRVRPKGFVEADGYVSIEAEHYTRRVDSATARWEKISDYGRTLSAMTIFPVTAAAPKNPPCLEYEMYLFDPQKVQVEAILGPTLNFVPGRGLRFAIAFDDQAPQVVDALASNSQTDWETSVKDSVRKVRTTHTLAGTGAHTLKVWMVDPGVVLEKLVVDLGGLQPSYLGPPESFHSQD
jgi:hypothetical protein